MANLVCPHCGRKLMNLGHSGAVTCDGCEQTFDPLQVYLRPAALPKRVVGWTLLILGLLLLIPSTSIALKYNLGDRDIVMTLVGTFLLPTAAIFSGLALKHGKLVIKNSSEPEAKSSDT